MFLLKKEQSSRSSPRRLMPWVLAAAIVGFGLASGALIARLMLKLIGKLESKINDLERELASLRKD